LGVNVQVFTSHLPKKQHIKVSLIIRGSVLECCAQLWPLPALSEHWKAPHSGALHHATAICETLEQDI
jgi:hypothetical protein